MNNIKYKFTHKFISALLLVVMLFAALGSASLLPVYAASDTSPIQMFMQDYYKAREDYIFDTAEKKWATMVSDYTVTYGNYEMRLDPRSGEMGFKDLRTGEILFSNPYDVTTTCGANEGAARMLLSQLAITYIESTTSYSTTEKTLYSFEGAWYDRVKGTAAAKNDRTDDIWEAQNELNQLSVSKLKNGFMVEYTLGEQEKRTVVPYRITPERFETLIWNNFPDEVKKKFQVYKNDPAKWTVGGMLYYLDDSYVDDNEGREKNQTVYKIDLVNTRATLIQEFEDAMKEYCPDYSYAERQHDHDELGYGKKGEVKALFKMAIEYTLGANGLTVRLPANSIRFDESNFQLVSVSLLPYFGAGNATQEGYTFLPDGSGALIEYSSKNAVVNSGMYGNDYSYHDLTGATGNSQVTRLPVFGAATVGAEKSGFLAIIEEGVSMASITAGNQHKYSTAYTRFSPRPRDKYNLSDTVASAGDAEWTVVSERKYTGSYQIRFTMLHDDAKAAEAGILDYYECSYMGMARAYRDYLEDKGYINRMTSAEEKLPLYMETLGVIDSEDTIFSFPVTVKTALTTFEDIKKMYLGYDTEDGEHVDGLKDAGITNVVIRLNGYANGGVTGTVPYYVDFEDDLGGDEGFREFLAFAQENGMGVYPDFDFAYLHSDSWFDGFTFKGDAAKTIDGRYTQKQSYDPVYQCFAQTGLSVISPVAYNRLFAKFSEEMKQFYTEEMKANNIGISVSTLGSDLNSDFDEDEPYNREDTRGFTEQMLVNLKKQYANIMIDGGNSYALPYASHVLNVALDSSRHLIETRSIPFFGLVFHGYLNYAGTPTNMASSRDYESLKIIENGASPYFILAYQNTSKLKDNPTLAKYYSISYDFWYKDIVSIYTELNDVLADVQLPRIANHAFMKGERILSAAEAAYEEAVVATLTGAKLDEYLANSAANRVVNDGTIVKVVYENGVTFYLNYNQQFAVSVDGYEVPALSFIRVDADTATSMEHVSVYRSQTQYYYNNGAASANVTIDGHTYAAESNDFIKYEVLATAEDGKTVVCISNRTGRTIYNYTTKSYTFAETSQTVAAGASVTVENNA